MSSSGDNFRKNPDANVKTIAYSKEATHAMKRKGPSDKRLKEILLTNCQSKAATDQEQRWMAGHILEMNGYKLEE